MTVGRVKLKPALVLKLESKVSVLPERVTPVVAAIAAIDVGQEGMGEIRRLGAAEPARQGDGDGDADGDAGIDRVGEMDRVAVGAALVDGGAGLGEREGLGVVVDDGGGDAGGGGERDRGAVALVVGADSATL